MKCSRCGSTIENGSSICYICGNKVEYDASLDNNDSVFFQNQPNNSNNLGLSMNQMSNDVKMNNNFNNGNMNSNGQNNQKRFINNFNAGDNNSNAQKGQKNFINNFNNDVNSTSSNDFVNFSGAGFSKSNNFNASVIKTSSFDGSSYFKPKDSSVKEYGTEQKKDIFDLFSEHGTAIMIVFFMLIIGVGTFIGYKYYLSKVNGKNVKPIVNALYYEVDSSFEKVGSNSNEFYVLSGSKGTDCSISISFGTSTSVDHISEYFENSKKSIEPETDREGNIIDEMQKYKSYDGSVEIGGTNWYYLNVFYRPSSGAEYTSLKNVYISSMYRGYYYDVALFNNGSNKLCSGYITNFVNSLRFVDK